MIDRNAEGNLEMDIDSRFNRLISTAAFNLQKDLSQFDTLNYPVSRRLVQFSLNKNFPSLLDHVRKFNPTLDLSLVDDISQKIVTVSLTDFLWKLCTFCLLNLLGSLFILLVPIHRNKQKNIAIINSSIDSLTDSSSLHKTLAEKIFKNQLEIFFIFRSKKKSSSTNKYLTSRYPIYSAVLHTQITWRDIFYFYRVQLLTFAAYFKLILRKRSMCYLSNDFFNYPFIKLMDKKGVLHSYIKSNSEFQFQEFWLDMKTKNYRFITFFYSLNTVALKYKHMCSYENVFYHFTSWGEVFTWSTRHQDWLEKLGAKDIVQTSPIVFFKNPNFPNIPKNSIAVFDVTPYSQELLKNIIFNFKNFYYSEENSFLFIKNIIRARNEVSPSTKIILKRKKKPGSNNIEIYSRFLNYLERKKVIEIISHDCSVEDLITNSQLTISIPFTSTNHVANWLKKTSIYYDPTNTLDLSNLEEEHIYYLSDLDSLKRCLRNLL